MSNHGEVDRKESSGNGTPPGAARRDRAARTAHGKRGRRILLGVLLALVLAVPGSMGAYVFSMAQIFASQTREIKNAFPAEAVRVRAQAVPAGSAKPINILVMGSDSRDASGGAAAEAAAGAPSNQRSDTLMLVHIPADRAHIYSISIMRDLWTTIPGHGEAKINAALAFGGVPLVVQTVESLLQQRIDQVVRIDFEGFQGLVDAIGGVTVDVKVPFTGTRAKSEYVFNAGPNTLDGARALAFVRERYAFADGDYQRVRNQQLLLAAVIGKTLDAGTVQRPLTLEHALSAVAPFVSVAPALDLVEAGRLAVSLRDVHRQDIAMFTLPTAGTGTSADGQSIVLPDPSAIEEIKAALSNDRLGDYVAAQGLGAGN
ncbi:LCP family protein [Arthrobacter sp. H16F315]|uniref:LCP family protein n=1 Tax=Arthrobacter sp. H16F315 TaxID=2955314 RepID=UPI0020977D4B|nr:LCP family protein [Arthrobacter sp. H16F315]MDD1476644.1 LCP family protein [Arthrobacter sp. H16F315]